MLMILQEEHDLVDLMMKVFKEGLEGLVLKDVNVRNCLFIRVTLFSSNLNNNNNNNNNNNTVINCKPVC